MVPRFFGQGHIGFPRPAGTTAFCQRSTSGWLFPTSLVLTDRDEVVVEVRCCPQSLKSWADPSPWGGAGCQ